MTHPEPLVLLITQLSKLPGIGRRTAERLAYALLDWPEEERTAFAKVMAEAPSKLAQCATCYCLKEAETVCKYCESPLRNEKVLCVVTSWKDVFAIEATNEYTGLYHVLPGTLSPLEGRNAEDLNLNSLLKRLTGDSVTEVIIALDSTLEGDATSLFLKEELEQLDIAVSRLAFGLPMGSALDYVDGGTLTQAFLGRARL